MSDRIVGAAPSPGRLLVAAEPGAGPAGKALDLLSIIVAAVEQAPGMAVRGIDGEGLVRYWSPGAARLYGVTAELAVGQPWATVAAALPDGAVLAGQLSGELAAVRESGKARSARLWKLGGDGAAPRCICSTVFPVMQSGRVRQVVCIDIDLTASGQDSGQGALLLMGDNFRQLYEKSADAIVLLRDEHIAEANPAAIALFQCGERSRLLGRRLSDFSPLRQPDGALSSLLGTQLAAQAHAHGNWRYDWRYQTCQGELFWGEVLLTSVTLDHSYLFYAVIRDISSRKLAERALFLSAQVVEHAREAIVVMDPQQRVVSMNPAYSELSGFSRDDLLDKSFVLHHTGPDELAFFAHVWEEVDTNGYWQGDIVGQRKDGQRYPAWLSLTAIRDSQGQLSNYMAILSDISERKKSEEHTRHLAEHDFLTDLPNRVLLLDRLSLALAAARRKRSLLAILYLDLDHFKHINDSMGHHVGDLLLKEVARRLVRCVRGVDTVSRHGGDEFVIILAEVGGIDQAAHVAASLLQAVTQPYPLGEYELHVSTSIGVAIFPSDGESIDSLLHNADIAMYHAKEGGRNNFQFFNAHMHAQILERASLEQDLRAALGNDEFVLEFQPALEVASGRIVGAEALLRWRHPRLGLLPPERFIGVAEECGLMVSIGNWVLQQACARARAWHDAGQAWTVAVNLSAAQCLHNHLWHSVQEALQVSGLPAARLELEVTEALLMKGGARLADVLAQLRALGVRVAIDDFGTGYSRLANLRHYPVDKLKIDPSFLPGIADAGTAGASDTAVAATIIAMARELQLTVIAEGVETARQLAFLQAQGCQQYQGRHASAQAAGSALAELLN